ncbi:hypothetical protein [Confluentibacter citreus]|uniref:hypothetical protein n=1 Tax=Confluentibacter citreus TaxID=2007307 RepID=UPI000C28AC65|nr:hypothetical protein [Confluentibacter citreus]
MITKTPLSVIFFFVFNLIVHAQIKTIEGTVYNETFSPINAKLLIRKSSEPQIIKEFHIIRKGSFSYTLSSQYEDDFILEIASDGYESYTEIIDIMNTPDVIHRDIYLDKTKLTELKEVVIKGNKRPFEIKKDTLSFDVEAYRDGTERKVEDLLKNLPGIEVNSKTGAIKYNGKSIETVMLEGDDLFGYNYSIGTKNINIDIIQSVEAIENYSENKLLKGIENSEKVALNLKLKPSKLDFSGSLNAGLGYSDNDKPASNSSINALAINKSFKSYGIASFNNIGINSSSANYTNNVMDNLESIKEMNYSARGIIPETVLSQTFDEKRTYINEQLFTNYNNLFNLAPFLKAKVNFYYLDDSISNFESLNNNYFINNVQFQTFDNNQVTNNPKHYRGDLKLDISPSKTSLIEYNLSLRDKTTKTNRFIFSNILDNINSIQHSDNFFLIQNLLYTKKLSDKKAMQINFMGSTNSILQKLEITPSIFALNSDIQDISLKKDYFKFNTTFLGSSSINKYSLSIGSNLIEEPLKTNFISLSGNNDTISNGLNNMRYNKKEVYAFAENVTKWNKFSLKYSFNLRYLNQTIVDKTIQNSKVSERVIFEPTLTLSHNINSNSYILTGFSINKNTFDSSKFLGNNILISHRNILKNEPALRLQNNQIYNLSYNNNDLFNQFHMGLGINYLKQEGNFFENSQITENTILTNYFFLPKSFETIDLNLNFTKYIPFLKLNVKTNTYYSIDNYKNVINGSDIRNNKSHSLNSELFIKTSFKSYFNVENEIFYRLIKTTSEVEFENSYLHNKLKLIFKPTNQWLSTFSFDYFIPDLNSKKSFSLLDTTWSYSPNKKKWGVDFIGGNLTNVKYFTTFQNDDTSINSYSIGLIPRYLMFGFHWDF